MSLFLIRFLAFTLPLAAARPAQCVPGSSAGPNACASGTSDGEILLHTRSHLGVMEGVTESHQGRRAFELDHLGESRESSNAFAEYTSKVARQQAWVSYRGTLGMVLSNLETSRKNATGGLEDTINKFISEQAGSGDAVSAKLKETKHQLNQIHMHVNDLAMQINATDHEVTALNAQVKAKNEASLALKIKCEAKLAEVEKQQKEDLAFLDKLKGELEEMIQIANPDITMNQTGRSVNSAGSYSAGGKTVESLLGDKFQADQNALLPFLKGIKIPAARFRYLKKSDKTSLVQVNVQDDGQMTVVQRATDVFAPLKKGMRKAARCMMGRKKVSLVVSKQAPSEGPTGDEGDDSEESIGKKVEEAEEAEEAEDEEDLKKPEEGEGTDEEGSDGPPEEKASGSNLSNIFDGMPSKDVQCKNGATAKVQIGNATADVTLRRDLAKGERSNVPCVKLNEKYFGIVWFTCNEKLEADGSKCLLAANATGCQEELEKLQEVYVKTYVDLSRLVESYEEKTTEGYEADKGAIEDQCRDQQSPLQKTAAELAEKATKEIEKLQELRPKLEDAHDAYEKLAKQVKKLQEQAKILPETLSDLDKVRDTIKAMSLCPGLENANLGVPQWVGSYLDFEEPLGKHTDEEYDALMREACEKAFGEKVKQPIRAASVAEMEAHAVLDLPITNTAETPLIGPCPACEGDEDAGSSSGHKRICWKPGANLTVGERFSACSSGQKSIACVIHEAKNR